MEGNNVGKKGKGLIKEHEWMTHGHTMVWGLTVGAGVGGVGRAGQSNGGKIGAIVIEQQ